MVRGICKDSDFIFHGKQIAVPGNHFGKRYVPDLFFDQGLALHVWHILDVVSSRIGLGIEEPL